MVCDENDKFKQLKNFNSTSFNLTGVNIWETNSIFNVYHFIKYNGIQ